MADGLHDCHQFIYEGALTDRRRLSCLCLLQIIHTLVPTFAHALTSCFGWEMACEVAWALVMP